MPRQARVVAVGAAHHITQRGNNRQDVFLVDEDRLTYLNLIAEQSRACGLVLLGYCLMTNHVHLVAVPDRADSMARTLRRAHSRYAQWSNRRYHRSGHLWQGRYFSCNLGPRPLGDGFGLRRSQPCEPAWPVGLKIIRGRAPARTSTASTYEASSNWRAGLRCAGWPPGKKRCEIRSPQSMPKRFVRQLRSDLRSELSPSWRLWSSNEAGL